MKLGLRARVVCLASAVAALAAFAPPDSPVADAAMKGDVEAVRSLLASGADVNAAQGDGMTALHWAAERGQADIADVLLYAGANPAAVTRIGKYTPLHLASRSGSVAVVERLLGAGADVSVATREGQTTPLHLGAASGNADVVRMLLDHGADIDALDAEWGQTPLIFAAAQNRVEAVRVLLEAGADHSLRTKVTDLQFESELERAAGQRQAKVLEAASSGEAGPTPSQVQAAVRAGRDVYLSGEIPEEEEEEDDDGRGNFNRDRTPTILATGGLTALLHSVRQGHRETTMALLEGGADVDLVSGADGTSPLLMAVINGQFDLAMMLIEHGADPNINSSLNGIGPLWAAVNAEWQPRTRFPQPQERGLQQATYLDVMEALLEAGAEVDVRTTLHPWYMVYTGCGNGNCGLADTKGSTPFWRAAYATDVAAMKLLVAWGADPDIPTMAPAPRDNRPGGGGPQAARFQTAAAAAAAAADSAKAAETGEAPESEQVAAQGAERRQMARQRQEAEEAPKPAAESEESAETPEEEGEEEPELDPSGLPPVPEGGPGVFAIHAASGVKYGEGFAGNAHRHAPDGWLPSVKYLIEELGADVNARDSNGYTALHHAAARGDNELILYLVEMGGDVTVVSRRGQTTADMANGPVSRISPHPRTVALLESLGSKNNNNCASCQ